MKQEDSAIFMKGIVILTISSIITKILSAIYRVPFQNIVGDIGFYIYQQVYPLYGIVIALATSGFPVVISRLVAERRASGEKDYRSLMKMIFIVLLSIALFLFFLIYIGAHEIAQSMGDKRLSPLIQTVAFSFLFLPIISTVRGFFQGHGEMIPTAFSQVLEQTVRVAGILLFSFFMVKGGFSLYTTGKAAIIGSVCGGLVSCIVLITFFYKTNKYNHLSNAIEWRELLRISRILLFEGTAICISAILLVLFQLIDSLNLLSLLRESGISSNDAKTIKGIYDRGQPFLQLGTVVATSFALTLVPIITDEYKRGQRILLEEKVQLALKVSTIVGAGATIGLINLIEPANTMLFENKSGSSVLAVFSLSILFSTAILTMTGIFQGFGYVYFPAIYVGIGGILKYFTNEWFVPHFGTMGASISTVLSLFVITVLFLMKLRKLKFHAISFPFYGKVIVGLGLMTLVLRGWLYIFTSCGVVSRKLSIIEALGGVLFGGIVYLLTILYLNVLTENEWNLIPFGRKLFAIRKKIWRDKYGT
ncbi:putative polysaccharide biosynthesis protein [Heyndrickxia ginsengihumi]